MSSITIKDLSRADALKLLKNVQKNAAPGFAIGGNRDCRYVNTDTINATVEPQQGRFGQVDYSKNTFKIYSSYWVKSTLEQYMEDRVN